MKKYIIATLFASILGVVLNPEILAASDHVTILDLHNTTETVLETTPVAKTADFGASLLETPTNMLEKIETPATASAKIPANEIKIAGRTLEVRATDSTAVDAETHVNYYAKLLYGHNIQSVFGVLTSVKAGDIFTVTFDGKTTTYRVASTAVYEKADLTVYYMSGNVKTTPMARIARKAQEYVKVNGVLKETGKTHDVALMTCYGTMLPGSDATHRLVIYADEI